MPASLMEIAHHEFPNADLSPLEARILGVLVEKEKTTPDTYPLTLNSLAAGCNQKTSRDPVMSVSERIRARWKNCVAASW